MIGNSGAQRNRISMSLTPHPAENPWSICRSDIAAGTGPATAPASAGNRYVRGSMTRENMR